MKLHLLRHAKTEVLSMSRDDFHRQLLPKGVIQSNMMGQHLSDLEIELKETLCSDAVRTRQTLKVVSEFIDSGKISFLKELYLADRDTYLRALWSLPHGKDILIVGHNEGISELACYFTEQNIHLKTCGYVAISFPFESWKETSMGTGTITHAYRPQVYFPD
jgi:phosphohistidine phosphatase